MDAASSARDESLVPKQRDLSICLNCGAAMVLDGKRWRQVTAADLAGLDPEERAELAEHQIKQAIAKAAGILPDLARRGGRA
jgi:hypothetical protein